jgi:hypothetical protein
MSIFGNIMGAIFGHAQAQAPAQQRPASGMQAAAGGAAQSQRGQQSQAAGPAGTTAPKQGQPIDVEPILDKLTAGKQLDWRHSIVDLMKALNLDSSFAARKELANELHYSGDPNDSAAMNVWLHKQVMIKLAENGGKVPESLKH